MDALYRSYLQVIDFAIANLATPYQIVIEKYLSTVIANLMEFLKTAKINPVPTDWITAISTLPVLGEEVVIVMASSLADPDDTADLFKQHFIRTFGKHRPKITQRNLRYADYLRMWLEGMTIGDIADVDIQLHRLEYPENEESLEYKTKKRQTENRIEHGIKRLWDKLGKRIPDEKI